MKLKRIILILLIFASCRSKYDTSKAIDVLPTEEVTIDYRLKDLPFQIDDESSIVHLSQHDLQSVKKLQSFVKAVEYSNGKLFLATNTKLTVIDIERSTKTKEDRRAVEKFVKHSITNPLLTTHGDFTLLFDEKGNFSVFHLTELETEYSLESVWYGRIGLSDVEFLKENEEKGLFETINPSPKKQVITLSSRFTCHTNQCYAMTVEGILVTLDLTLHTVQMKQMFQKQDIILDSIYQPLISNGNIVFATGNSEFAIYNIQNHNVIGQSTFVDQESSSMFDINIIKSIYSAESSVIISHLNGVYAFNIVQGHPIWTKNFIIDSALISGNYMILFDVKSQKLICLHIQTGEAKWTVKLDTASVLSLNVTKNSNEEYSLSVGEPKGFRTISLQDGTEQYFKKANLSNVSYYFVHNGNLYYIKKGNIYKVK